LAELSIGIGFQYFSAKCGFKIFLYSSVKWVDTLAPEQSKVKILEQLRVKRRALKMTFSCAISFLRVTFVTKAIVLPLVTHSNTFLSFG